MKIYRTSIRNSDHEHVGFQHHGSQLASAAYRQVAKAEGKTVETEQIEVKATKAGILRALNLYGGHANNG